MKQFRVEITAQSPLTFPERKPNNEFRNSLPYVPGAALYGALGELYGKNGAFDADLFRRLRCHNAYAVGTSDEWVRPLPATAQQAKGTEQQIFDTLVERVCWEQQQPAALLYAPTDAQGNPWVQAKGFYTIEDQEEGKSENERIVKRNPPPQRAITRVGIDRRRKTSQENILYSAFVISEQVFQEEGSDYHPTRFIGSMVCDEQDDVEERIKAVRNLGGRRSTGIGQVEIDTGAVADDMPLQERIVHLTRLFREQATHYAKLRGTSFAQSGSIFTVNLLSDAILLEEGWIPTMVLTGEMLAEATDGRVQATLLRSFASYDYVGGWQMLWKRPKESYVRTKMGSLYVFQVDAPLGGDQLEALAQVQLRGIGERVREGYGQVRICDEFHLYAKGATK